METDVRRCEASTIENCSPSPREHGAQSSGPSGVSTWRQAPPTKHGEELRVQSGEAEAVLPRPLSATSSVPSAAQANALVAGGAHLLSGSGLPGTSADGMPVFRPRSSGLTPRATPSPRESFGGGRLGSSGQTDIECINLLLYGDVSL
eukprot:323597-Chlamydomonas_euryale.AAC.6